MLAYYSILLALTLGLCDWSLRTGPSLHAASAETIYVEDDHPLLNDPDVLMAMEIFMGMSSEEREEAIHGLMKAAGDDPGKRAEMEMIISKLPALDEETVANSMSNLNQMVKDDEISKAKEDARQILDGTSWEFFWQNQAELLENVIASGQISPENAARFKTDEVAWKKQLKVIWEDLAKKE
mmetsp:Transcript_24717/g.49161  ORF Transcript_24717/g.49161 Transcript_24717/m.49161 type:complete len:182 (-) Transcript_24717:156-701(-)|eukprot:CAMPEP_0194305134 /NCGR_PEP_ID=MMETSP0171-20130528/2641_1 /TAXON_ID=218684 /ORGANISM="Corethron pennatum, Strain L29A3" /LENGTH=181 /DNA_ID=CAMNT_0039056567 /DNA_START=89 /DNA_END=634 /DNA_ORIENTATION=+